MLVNPKHATIDGEPCHQDVAACRKRPTSRSSPPPPTPSRPRRRARRPRRQGGGGHHRRLRRGRRGPRPGLAPSDARRGAPAPPPHRRPELPRHHGAGPRALTPPSPTSAPGRASSRSSPSPAPSSPGSWTGRPPVTSASRTWSRWATWPMWTSAISSTTSRSTRGTDGHPPAHRGGDPRPQVHVGGAGRRPPQAGGRAEGRAPRRGRPGGRLPHRGARRRRCGVRGGLPPRRHAPRPDAARAVRRRRDPGAEPAGRWRRLAVVTNGGGFGVLATDALVDEGGRLAELAPGDAGAPRRGLCRRPGAAPTRSTSSATRPGSRYADALAAAARGPGDRRDPGAELPDRGRLQRGGRAGGYRDDATQGAASPWSRPGSATARQRSRHGGRSRRRASRLRHAGGRGPGIMHSSVIGGASRPGGDAAVGARGVRSRRAAARAWSQVSSARAGSG